MPKEKDPDGKAEMDVESLKALAISLIGHGETLGIPAEEWLFVLRTAAEIQHKRCKKYEGYMYASGREGPTDRNRGT